MKNIINILKEIKNNTNRNSFLCFWRNIYESKTLLNSLLKYLPLLEKRSILYNKFIEDKLTNICNELKDIKSNLIGKNSIISEQKSIPIKWFLDSLIQYLPRLPDEYTKNDYELLLKELENDINNSINELDFDYLSKIYENMIEIKKNKYYYQKVKNIIIDIGLNKQVNEIIETEQIPVNIIFEDNKLYIRPIVQTDNNYLSIFSYFTKKEEEGKEGNSIKTFIKNFPNIVELQKKPGVDIINSIKEM